MKKCAHFLPLIFAVLFIFLFITIDFFVIFRVDRSVNINLPKNNLYQKLGLNKPTHEQYIKFLGSAFIFKLGPSLTSRTFSVNELINPRLVPSVFISGIISIIIFISFFLPYKKIIPKKVHYIVVIGSLIISIFNVYLIRNSSLTIPLSLLVFILCIGFVYIRHDFELLNYLTFILIIYTLWQSAGLELIFNLKGIQSLIVSALRKRDIPLLWGIKYYTVVISTFSSLLCFYSGYLINIFKKNSERKKNVEQVEN